MNDPSLIDFDIQCYKAGILHARRDSLSIEEPLEIVLDHYTEGAWQRHSIAVLMRTPGHDRELAIGFLISESAIPGATAIIKYEERLETSRQRVILRLDESLRLDLWRMTRHVFTSSSCGVCGKTTIDQVRVACLTKPHLNTPFSSERLLSLPEKLRQAQLQFARSGALHAAGLFNSQGDLLLLREDVGRHNALDKLLGFASQQKLLPLFDHLLLLSGRASFELIQKAAIAGIPLVAAVGGPSSLAVQLAKEMGMTLVGFLREQTFNIYSRPEQLIT